MFLLFILWFHYNFIRTNAMHDKKRLHLPVGIYPYKQRQPTVIFIDLIIRYSFFTEKRS